MLIRALRYVQFRRTLYARPNRAALTSADEHAQTSENPNMATATPLGPAGAPDGAEAARRVRSRWTRGHPPPASVLPGARHGRSLPRCGELAFRTPTRHRARTGNLEGASSPATEQPGIRGLRIGLATRQWRLRDACGLSRLNDFLTLWSQGAHAVL
jgi:hypothetical protein